MPMIDSGMPCGSVHESACSVVFRKAGRQVQVLSSEGDKENG